MYFTMLRVFVSVSGCLPVCITVENLILSNDAQGLLLNFVSHNVVKNPPNILMSFVSHNIVTNPPDTLMLFASHTVVTSPLLRHTDCVCFRYCSDKPTSMTH